MSPRSLVAALAVLGAGAVYALNLAPLNGADPASAKLQTSQFIRTTRAVQDGGTGTEEVWHVKSCAYVMLSDGGHSLEPCWDDTLTTDQVAAMEALIMAYDAGTPPPQRAEAF